MKYTYRIKPSSIIVLSLIVLLVSLSIIAKPKEDVYDLVNVNRVIKQVKVEDNDSLDALILGDSEVYTAYSPLQMYQEEGFTSFNTGIQSLRVCDAYAILKGVLETQHPQVVVVDAGMLYRFADPYEEKDPFLTAFGKVFPILHYHSIYKNLKSPKELIKQTNPKQSKGYELKGFVPKIGTQAYTESSDYMNTDMPEEPLSSQAQQYMDAILSLCNDKNIQVLMIATPSPLNWDEGKSLGTSAYCKEKNIPFIDLNKEDVGISWSKDTLDGGDHMNFDGSKKCSTWLAEYLKNHYQFNDQRGHNETWDDLVRKNPFYNKENQ